MLEILQFIFQDFWHWVGSVILLSIIVGGVVPVLVSIFKGRINYD